MRCVVLHDNKVSFGGDPINRESRLLEIDSRIFDLQLWFEALIREGIPLHQMISDGEDFRRAGIEDAARSPHRLIVESFRSIEASGDGIVAKDPRVCGIKCLKKDGVAVWETQTSPALPGRSTSRRYSLSDFGPISNPMSVVDSPRLRRTLSPSQHGLPSRKTLHLPSSESQEAPGLIRCDSNQCPQCVHHPQGVTRMIQLPEGELQKFPMTSSRRSRSLKLGR